MGRPHLVLVRDEATTPAAGGRRRSLLRERHRREVAPAGTTVVLEPGFGRWHLDPDCAVLRAQPDVAVVMGVAPETVARGCSICTAIRH